MSYYCVCSCFRFVWTGQRDDHRRCSEAASRAVRTSWTSECRGIVRSVVALSPRFLRLFLVWFSSRSDGVVEISPSEHRQTGSGRHRVATLYDRHWINEARMSVRVLEAAWSGRPCFSPPYFGSNDEGGCHGHGVPQPPQLRSQVLTCS